MHSMQMGLEQCTISVHTEILCKYIKEIYRYYCTRIFHHLISQRNFLFHCIVQLYERFCATVRTHFECTCEFALVHPTQTATLTELTTSLALTHARTLEKINENKKKTTDTGKEANNVKESDDGTAKGKGKRKRIQLQTRLIIARRGAGAAECVCVCVRGKHTYTKSARLHRHFHSSRSRCVSHTHAHIQPSRSHLFCRCCVCVPCSLYI